MDAIKNYLFYTLVTGWDEPPRARHQLATEFAKEGNVYFVERNRRGTPRLEVRKVSERIFVITPFYWLDYKIRYRIPFINERYHHWLLKKLKALDLSFEIVVNFDYTATPLATYFSNTIFYCADNNVGFGKFNPFFINWYHSKTERLVAAKAKLCIVTSDFMRTKIGAYNEATFFVPLGAPDINFTAIKPPIKNKEVPVIGLVGYLDSNLDYPLLEQLLQKFKIVFIGPANPENRQRLSRFENASLVGTKTGTELYQCLQEVDICIAPYDVTLINEGATPNKLWLYLAMGKPTVVTNIPNIKNWHFEDKLVYKCDNDIFIQSCEKAYVDDSVDLSKKRVALSKLNSWENRVTMIKELYYRQMQL